MTINKSSLCYWYPKIEGRLPTPRTEIMPVTEDDVGILFGLLDGNALAGYEGLKERLGYYGDHFKYPLFLRTDETSGKHMFEDTCYVTSKKDIMPHAVTLFEDTIISDISLSAYVFREFVPLLSGFKAFKGLPISSERRYFVDDGKVLCHHPYWPEDAIEFWGRISIKEPDGWKDLLIGMNHEPFDEVAYLTMLATVFSRLVPGAWSVDFAKTKKGDWLLIDAAEAHRSWHPSNCKVAFGDDA